MTQRCGASVYLESLGCDKNKVDGEVMLGRLMEDGFSIVGDPGEARIIIVNTCGFIKEAIEESIETILNLAAYKEKEICGLLVVVGCMTERYRDQIHAEMPEIDLVLGVADRDEIVNRLRSAMQPNLSNESPPRKNLPQANTIQYRLLARENTPNPHIAYVKIAEGCDNRCAYCTIPKIRGRYRSRPQSEIMEECMALVNDGVRELILVAQDTASYGVDLCGKPRLAELLRKLDANFGTNCSEVVRVRLLYAYPEHITPELIDAIAELPSVCKYLDMPIQHSEDTTLARMGRRGTRSALEDLIRRLRKQIPEITLRTTLMVGFPGETNEEFRALYGFVKDIRFDRLGVFPYSREEDTPAVTMPKQVKSEIKHIRRDRIMALQQKIHMKKQREKLGKPLEAMVDGEAPSADDSPFFSETDGSSYRYIGRAQSDAPEVDSVIYISSERKLSPGQVVTVIPVSADEYDLQGREVHTHEPAE